ncbi:MAG: TRAM domain-containing protein, partial [Fusobacteria bacterium]|nr:TRAM domain-containing protein [Fusobacteriota bacterium]
KAEIMPNHLSEEVKSSRLRRLIELQSTVSNSMSQNYLDTIQEILIEGNSEKSDEYLQGRTDSNKVVLVKADGIISPGDFIKVKIVEAKTWTLYGERV